MGHVRGRLWQVGEAFLTRPKAHILCLLLTHPDGITREEIMGKVWDDDNGGLTSLERVSVHVRGVNEALAAAGVPARIVASHGRYSRYALVREEG
jgi:DNA-binding response OmpR family regulator